MVHPREFLEAADRLHGYRAFYPAWRRDWQRLLDNPGHFGKQKANFVGRYKGQWWCPPFLIDASLVNAVEVWIVKNIFDAISLYHHGKAAVSAMSCANYPNDVLSKLSDAAHQAGTCRPTLI